MSAAKSFLTDFDMLSWASTSRAARDLVVEDPRDTDSTASRSHLTDFDTLTWARGLNTEAGVVGPSTAAETVTSTKSFITDFDRLTWASSSKAPRGLDGEATATDPRMAAAAMSAAKSFLTDFDMLTWASTSSTVSATGIKKDSSRADHLSIGKGSKESSSSMSSDIQSQKGMDQEASTPVWLPLPKVGSEVWGSVVGVSKEMFEDGCEIIEILLAGPPIVAYLCIPICAKQLSLEVLSEGAFVSGLSVIDVVLSPTSLEARPLLQMSVALAEKLQVDLSNLQLPASFRRSTPPQLPKVGTIVKATFLASETAISSSTHPDGVLFSISDPRYPDVMIGIVPQEQLDSRITPPGCSWIAQLEVTGYLPGEQLLPTLKVLSSRIELTSVRVGMRLTGEIEQVLPTGIRVDVGCHPKKLAYCRADNLRNELESYKPGMLIEDLLVQEVGFEKKSNFFVAESHVERIHLTSVQVGMRLTGKIESVLPTGIRVDVGCHPKKLAYCRADNLRNELESYKPGMLIEDLLVQEVGSNFIVAEKHFGRLKEGDCFEGTVRSVKEYGVFFNSPGGSALCPLRGLSWPLEEYKEGMKVSNLIYTLHDGRPNLRHGRGEYQLECPESEDDQREAFGVAIGDSVTGRVICTLPYGLVLALRPFGSDQEITVRDGFFEGKAPKPLEAYKEGDVLEKLKVTRLTDISDIIVDLA
eukprot:TRINITY_DN10510_c0_g2_i7.p1 TRINITY_DN10510_c0_g2~~TRINITY_DN10510_c0_g2_i7.p1  ORF type:complete len:776 (-),score=173.00 TRINITY_DN10510_c0_g2_i7:150-2246(-)